MALLVTLLLRCLCSERDVRQGTGCRCSLGLELVVCYQTVSGVELYGDVQRHTCEGHADGAYKLGVDLDGACILGEAGSCLCGVADAAVELDDVLVRLLLASLCGTALDERLLLLTFLYAERGGTCRRRSLLWRWSHSGCVLLNTCPILILLLT